MTESQYRAQSSIDRAVTSTVGILRRYVRDSKIRKISVTTGGRVYAHTSPLLRKFTGEYMSEEELGQIARSVEMLPKSAVKKTRGTWATRKFEAVFANGWKIRARKSLVWSQHSLVFMK